MSNYVDFTKRRWIRKAIRKAMWRRRGGGDENSGWGDRSDKELIAYYLNEATESLHANEIPHKIHARKCLDACRRIRGVWKESKAA